jgi:hypothetical protein
VLITIMVDGQTAVERIGKFLNEDGVEHYVETDQAPREVAVQIVNGSFKWAAPSANPAWDQANRYDQSGMAGSIWGGFRACFDLCCKKNEDKSQGVDGNGVAPVERVPVRRASAALCVGIPAFLLHTCCATAARSPLHCRGALYHHTLALRHSRLMHARGRCYAMST